MKLVCSAEYFDLADYVEVAVFYGDASTLHPEDILAGTVRLLHDHAPIASTEFDKFGGNGDGSFRIFFFHPSTVANLHIRVRATTVDGEELSTKAKVTTVHQDMSAFSVASNPAKKSSGPEDYDVPE